MMFRSADLWGHQRHLSPSLHLQESWISLNSMQFSFIILEYGYIMFAWQIILWNGWWPYNVYAEQLSDLKAKVCHFSEPTRCCTEPVKHYFTDFSWILIFLPTSFMQKMQNYAYLAVPFPLSQRPRHLAEMWNLSTFTYCTVWIMKYLFILCVKSWLPWRGSCPDGERPIGYNWDAVKLWMHELFAIS